MVDSKHKLPLKKVRLQRPGYDLYTKNQSRLQAIPGLFMTILVLCLIGGFVWYFDFFGLRNPQNVTVASSSPKPIIVSQSSSSSSQSSELKLAETETFIKITTTDRNSCYIQYTATQPSNISLPSSINSNIGWWLASSNCEINIQHIAVFRLTAEEKTNNFSSFGNKLQALDDVQPKTYALIFSSDSSSDTLNLRDQVKKLTLPIFQDRTYFKPSLAFSSLSRGEGVFYLDGTCENVGVGSCSLWYKNSSNQISLVTLTVLPGSNGTKIEFSQTQPNNANHIAIEQKNTVGEVIKSVVFDENKEVR